MMRSSKSVPLYFRNNGPQRCANNRESQVGKSIRPIFGIPDDRSQSLRERPVVCMFRKLGSFLLLLVGCQFILLEVLP